MNLKNVSPEMIAEITKVEVSDVWSNWLTSNPICCVKACNEVRTKYSVFCFKHMYKQLKTAVREEKVRLVDQQKSL